MLFAQSSPRPRRGFTLIELLTVVIIIGILAGLVTAAAIRVRGSVRKAAHNLELKQLEMALHAYKDRFGEFPPDDLRESNWPAIRRQLSKAFPRYSTSNWEAFKDHVLNPETGNPRGWGVDITELSYDQTLTFFLGGRWHNGQFFGFSANPTNPFDDASSRIGPFFDFDADRLDGENRHYYPTVEARQSGNSNRAIRYYRAENGGYNPATKGYIPFKDSRTATAPADMAWINPRSFQIISPGLSSAEFDDTVDVFACFPDGPYTAHQLEMMSNFTSGTMEDAMP